MIVTLVHGTFAPDAEWTKKDSRLRQALIARFGSDLLIKRFEWSGENSYDERFAAGQRLGKFLSKQSRKRPGARQIVIAHSHGGNIALYAGKHVKELSNIKGIACLGTPFIVARERESMQFIEDKVSLKSQTTHTYLAIMSTVLLVGIPASIFGAIGGTLRGSFADPDWFELVETGGAAALVIWAIASFMLVKKWLMRRYLHRLEGSAVEAEELMGKVAFAELPETDVLSITYQGDEAGSYLRVLEQTTETPHKLYGWSYIFGNLLVVVLWGSLIVTGLLALTGIVGIETAGKFLAIPLLAWALLQLVNLAVWFLNSFASVTPLLRSHRYGFGHLPKGIHDFLAITAEKEPFGLMAHSVRHKEMTFKKGKEQEGLKHSLIYEDKMVLDKLVNWITDCLDGRIEPTVRDMQWHPEEAQELEPVDDDMVYRFPCCDDIVLVNKELEPPSQLQPNGCATVSVESGPHI